MIHQREMSTKPFLLDLGKQTMKGKSQNFRYATFVQRCIFKATVCAAGLSQLPVATRGENKQSLGAAESQSSSVSAFNIALLKEKERAPEVLEKSHVFGPCDLHADLTLILIN